jgi:tRNA1(Val) A37 N6-methylase TrmN6
MRAHGQAKLGFYPLPPAEAHRLGNWLNFPGQFSALDPCVGDGVAFAHLLRDAPARRYGIEIDAYRAEQARNLGIETLQANAMDVRCPAETASLLYLNPPYDWEAGSTNNQRLEAVFLEHTYRWLKPGAVLLFVIPQSRLVKCARLLSEQFRDLRVFRLTEPACMQFKQIVVLGTRRRRHPTLTDSALMDTVRWLESLAARPGLEPLGEDVDVR